jgi:hypothetical protein
LEVNAFVLTRFSLGSGGGSIAIPEPVVAGIEHSGRLQGKLRISMNVIAEHDACAPADPRLPRQQCQG